MDCLLCHTTMQDGFASRETEDRSAWSYRVYHCLTCDTLCKTEDQMYHGGETWLFANGATLSLPFDVLEYDDAFVQRFRQL